MVGISASRDSESAPFVRGLGVRSPGLFHKWRQSGAGAVVHCRGLRTGHLPAGATEAPLQGEPRLLCVSVR